MPLSNYGELKTAIAATLDREDLTNNIPDFVELTLGMINRETRFRNRLMEATVSLTFTNNEATLPSDFLEARTVVMGTPRNRLVYLTPAQFEGTYTTDASGTPLNFTIVGDKMKVGPFPGGLTASLVYVQKVPSFTTDTSTNWMLSSGNADVLLYGACANATPFLGNDERLQVFIGLYDRAAAEFAGADSRARYNGAPIAPTLSVAIV